MNGKYYLTTSLAHLSGLSGIYEIKDPTKLTEIQSSDTNRERFFKKKSDKGLEKLYKSVGVTILLSFPYKNELYFITSNSKEGTFIAKRKDSELIKVKKLLDYRVYTYETEIKVTDDNHYLNNFRAGYEKKIGFFNVNDNIVSINIYE